MILPSRQAAALLAAVSFFHALTVSAATKTWNGSTTGSWQLPTNWLPSGVPVNGDALVFPVAATKLLTTNAPGGPTNFASILIQGDRYVLRSPPLMVTNGLTNAGPVLSTNSILASISPAGASTWSVISRNTLVLESNVSVGAFTLTLDVDGTLQADGNFNGAANSRVT